MIQKASFFKYTSSRIKKLRDYKYSKSSDKRLTNYSISEKKEISVIRTRFFKNIFNPENDKIFNLK